MVYVVGRVLLILESNNIEIKGEYLYIFRDIGQKLGKF